MDTKRDSIDHLIKQLVLHKEQNPSMKYLVVCGATVSGIGKGSTMSAIGALLKSCGLRVTCIKIDPYLNMDAGTMSPYEHGEVFVLDDGGEVDLDLGNYERSLGIKLTRSHNITSGKVYFNVLEKERKGEYLGKTVQVIPHITEEIKKMVKDTSLMNVERSGDHLADLCLIEIGGTIGDFEGNIFLEAFRQFISEVHPSNISFLVVTYIPELGSKESSEQKTKPTQIALRMLTSYGIFPNFVICRSDKPLNDAARTKIAFFSNLVPDNIFSCHNVDNILDVPMLLASQNLHLEILSKLKLPLRDYSILRWIMLPLHLNHISTCTEVRIAICGKYVQNHDTYYSIIKSLQDAAISANRKLKLEWLDCSHFDPPTNSEDENIKQQEKKLFWKTLEHCNGILIPGGFGVRGIEGMVEVCRYARENLIPYFGICLGMQVSVIEFSRNVLGLADANSLEFRQPSDDWSNDVITYMNDVDYEKLGGTLRLGSKTCVIKDPNSLAFKIYAKHEIEERHRHRYEVNPKFVSQLEEKGLYFTGKDKYSERMEILEIPNHPFFFGCQFHPEFKTHPFNPTPAFYSFILCSSKQYDKFKTFTKDRVYGITEFFDKSQDAMEYDFKNYKYESNIKEMLKVYEKVKEELNR